MSNGLLPRKLKTTIAKPHFSSPGYVQVRHKTARKFLVPDSFLPHLKKKNARWSPSKGDKYNHRWQPEKPVSDEASPLKDNHTQHILNNSIEHGVASTAAQEFGLSTEPILHAFCGQTHHPHIASSLKGYVSITSPNLSAVKPYWDAILNYLPEDPLNKAQITSPRGKLKHRSYTWASPKDDPGADGIRASTNRMILGWHLFLFTNSIYSSRLLFDGTDAKFLPGPSAIWRHRLWAGGSINLYRMFAPRLATLEAVHQVEIPTDLRIVGANKTPEKLFVTVHKQFHAIQGKISPSQYNIPGVIRALKKVPAFNKNNLQTDGPWLEEKYTLCFLRDPPDLSSKGAITKVIAPPLQPKFSHTFTPDRHLLFCWSALSYNAHLIHLDSAFAQKEYGAKDLIVHGPLTLILMLEWFQREITKYAIDRQLNKFHLISIDYKNLAPLYVNEPMTLCTKPTKFQTPGTLADSWDVWVQKEVGDGVQSMAFKGTIKLRIEQDPEKNPGSKQLKLQADPSTLLPGEEKDASEFKSPFF